MKVWFLVVMFLNDPNAKVSVYPTKAECEESVPFAKETFKKEKVENIVCTPGELKMETEGAESYI